MITSTRNGPLRPSTARLAAVLATLATPATAETVVLQGSTTFNSQMVAGHIPEIEQASGQSLTVIPNKSSLGLLALFDGKADLAMISTALDNEQRYLAASNPALPLDILLATVISRVPAVVITHPSNTVRSIAPADLRRVFTGEITDWRDLGGISGPIRLVTIRPGSGTIVSAEQAVLGTSQHITAPGHTFTQTGTQVITIVEQEPLALGIAQSKLASGRKVAVVETGPLIEQQLSLVSIGTPAPAAAAVIRAFQAAAAERME